MKIRDSVAVVTGASSGIGRACAVELARRGATVVGVARRADRLAALEDECRRFTPDSAGLAADLSRRDECDKAVAEILERWGRIDILVNNAGISIRKPAADTTMADIDRIFAINFFAAASLTTAALPGMLERGRGAVISITSVAGGVPNPKESAYAATKAGLAMWTHVLAVDLRGTGVHAGVVSPGPIDTEIWGLDEHPAAYKGKRYPPEVIAKAVAVSIERERVHVTVPRRFGMPPAMYWLFGRPMRWGLARYDARASAKQGRSHP